MKLSKKDIAFRERTKVLYWIKTKHLDISNDDQCP